MRMWSNRNIHCWWKCEIVWPLQKIIWQFLTKLKVFLAYDPVVMLLGTDPEDFKTHVCTKTYTRMFIAVLFITAKPGSNLDVLY